MAGETKRIIKRVFCVLFLFLLFVLLFPVAFAKLKVLQAQETQLIKLLPQGFDPDNDSLSYGYSAPFDQQGEWQTGYDDAGEYDLEITVSDGSQQTSEKVKLLVANKNQPPQLKEKKLVIKESQSIDFKKYIEDSDGDALAYNFSFPIPETGIWTSTYEDEGVYLFSFSASDGGFTEPFRMEVEVLHTNQPPEVTAAFSEEELIHLKEGEDLSFFVKAKDGDGDKVRYAWALDGESLTFEEEGRKSFSFTDAGRYILSLRLSDGERETARDWIIEVENVNRKPVLELLPTAVYEGDAVVVEVPETDDDGDLLSYTFEKPLNEIGEWQTSFTDAGTYNLTIHVSDGKAESKAVLSLSVVDVDRAPEVSLPEEILLREGELFFWKVQAADPDDDVLAFRFENLPEGMSFEEENATLSWKPGYDLISHAHGWWKKQLQNIFHKQLRQKYPATVIACGKELCSSLNLAFVVEDVNRAPLFPETNGTREFTFQETETGEVNIEATDPDGDKVKYTFSSPLNKEGVWKTKYGDAGEYPLSITASDGETSTTIPLSLQVLKKNRLPFIEASAEKVDIAEGQEFTLAFTATDPDDQEVSLTLENPPRGISFNQGILQWKPDFATVSDGGEEIIWLRVTASDGEANVTLPVQIKVKDVNQPPEILDYSPAESKEISLGQPVLFHLAAKDIDGDALEYRWNFGLLEEKIIGASTVERTFTSSGKKKVKVIVSDGKEEVEKEFSVMVKEPPTIQSLRSEVSYRKQLQYPSTNIQNEKENYPAPDEVALAEPQKELFRIKVYVIDG